MYSQTVTRTRRYSTPPVEVAPALREEEEELFEGFPVASGGLLRRLQMGRLSEEEGHLENVVVTDGDF